MDDYSENSKQTGETAEESTVFSAPAEHKKDKVKSSKKRGIIVISISVVTVLALVFGGLAVKKLIPEDNTGEGETDKSSLITVFDLDNSKFDTVTVKNENGEFVLVSDTEQVTDAAGDRTEKNWYLKGVDRDKISTSKTGDVVVSAAKISALLEITGRSYKDCGFENPFVTVSVTSAEIGDFSFILGDKAFDNSGRYLYCSIDGKTYMVNDQAEESFIFDALDLADASAIEPVKVAAKSSNYVNDDGSLISFDKLEISGSMYMHPVVITPVSEEEGANVSFVYKTTSPVTRFAKSDEVTTLFGVFSSGMSVADVCSFDTSAAAQGKFGLNNPDVVLKLTVAGESFTYKFASINSNTYAVFGDGMNTIKTVAASSEFLKISETDIYDTTVYIRSLTDIKNLTFSFDGNTYSFDVTENADDAEEMFTVYCGKQQITSEYFQNFYGNFVCVTLFEFAVDAKRGNAEMEIRITDINGAVQTISYTKASANSYNCYIDGKGAGRVTSAVFNKLVNDVKTISNNENVEF